MLSITANDLKRSGIAGIERAMCDSDEHSVVVDVRGKAKYVILSVEEFNQFREYQLDQAILEAEKCMANGEYTTITDFDGYATMLEKELASDI
tara:strand:+ start:1877 stop:2155 length:279 start_codon:yes stop_codon:yes gene_type:complete